jgi:hypothetical protein
VQGMPAALSTAILEAAGRGRLPFTFAVQAP